MTYDCHVTWYATERDDSHNQQERHQDQSRDETKINSCVLVECDFMPGRHDSQCWLSAKQYTYSEGYFLQVGTITKGETFPIALSDPAILVVCWVWRLKTSYDFEPKPKVISLNKR
jgi:hypothetical protein